MFSDKLIFEPPMPIRNSFYRCDSKFCLDDIIEMYTEDHDINGIIYTDGETCTWYSLENKYLKKQSVSNIHLQNQFKNGGQSSNRLARNRTIQREAYITKLAEQTVTEYYDKQLNKPKIMNIVFCGPAEFKIELSKHKLISSYFDSNTIHVLTMNDINLPMIHNLVESLDDASEIDTINHIRSLISNADDRLVFGMDEIQEMLECRMIGVLYVYHELNLNINININININNDYGCQIVRIKSRMIMNDYDGIIGVKFY